MSQSVCPWWMGYFLLNPIRATIHNPGKVAKDYLKEGMCVLDIGSGMGYFSIPMAKTVGEKGCIIAVDLQEKMLKSLIKRAEKAKLLDRIKTRLCVSNSLKIEDFCGKVDFALAFAVVHEVPDKDRLFKEIFTALRSGGNFLIAEPMGHVSEKNFLLTVDIAKKEGFNIIERPRIGKCHAVLLQRRE